MFYLCSKADEGEEIRIQEFKRGDPNSLKAFIKVEGEERMITPFVVEHNRGLCDLVDDLKKAKIAVFPA